MIKTFKDDLIKGATTRSLDEVQKDYNSFEVGDIFDLDELQYKV